MERKIKIREQVIEEYAREHRVCYPHDNFSIREIEIIDFSIKICERETGTKILKAFGIESVPSTIQTIDEVIEYVKNKTRIK